MNSGLARRGSRIRSAWTARWSPFALLRTVIGTPADEHLVLSVVAQRRPAQAGSTLAKQATNGRTAEIREDGADKDEPCAHAQASLVRIGKPKAWYVPARPMLPGSARDWTLTMRL